MSTWGIFQGDSPGTTPFSNKKLNDQISDLIAKRPIYSLQPEYLENQDIYRNQSYGRNRVFGMQEDNINQQVANDIYAAQQFSPSTSAILNTLGTISGSQSNALRGLAQNEATYQNTALNNLTGANTALGEEKDKQWNYNVNDPYQLKLNQLVQQKKFNQEMSAKSLDTLLSLATLGTKAFGK